MRALAVDAANQPDRRYDVATFQMPATLHGHPFTDGNGQTAEVIFLCILLQQGLLLLPACQWTNNQIDGTNVDQPIHPPITQSEARYDPAVVGIRTGA